MKNILFFLLTMSLLGGSCSTSQLQVSEDTRAETSAGKQTDTQLEKQTGKILDLSNQGLTKIPDDVFNKTNLEELDVSGNQLTGAIQAEVRQLKNLRVLNASNNNMTGVPAEIGQLQKLEVLNLSNNQLTGLPYELGNLNNLKTLDISGNDYSEQDLNIILEKLPTTVQIVE